LIFTELGMNIMPLETTPKFSFLLLAASNGNMEDM